MRKTQTPAIIPAVRYILGVDFIKRGELARPEFDLHYVSFSDGSITVRNLRRKDGGEFEAQNGEIFQIGSRS